MTRTIRRTLATMGVAALTTGAMATAAQADSASTDKVSSGPVQMNFNATTVGGTQGRFNGSMKIGRFGLMDVSGPVTCLDVEGRNVGIFYPITEASPFVLGALKSGVYMNIRTDGRGNAKAVSYSVVPFKKTGGCKPAPALLPAAGHVNLSEG